MNWQETVDQYPNHYLALVGFRDYPDTIRCAEAPMQMSDLTDAAGITEAYRSMPDTCTGSYNPNSVRLSFDLLTFHPCTAKEK